MTVVVSTTKRMWRVAESPAVVSLGERVALSSSYFSQPGSTSFSHDTERLTSRDTTARGRTSLPSGDSKEREREGCGERSKSEDLPPQLLL